MSRLLIALFALTMLAGLGLAQNSGPSESQGVYCDSNGAEAGTPGHWFKALEEDVPQFEGANPAEIAEIEDETWNDTANLGELVKRHCTTPASDSGE